jgi:uncharacterized lipoprotein YddW (UPF0748 family)
MKQYLILFGLFTLVLSFQLETNAIVYQSEDNNKTGVRGVWLTNVDSDVLTSREKIIEAVDFCKKLGFNTIFTVTYNKGFTLYPSKVMKQLFSVEIDSLYIGRDPLQELIEEAHKQNIKVFAWFEFGFSTSYQLNGGHILKAKPEWASKNVEGKLVVKNGFDWMNAFHPEAQNYMLSLIEEVVSNYKVDGIQGDDRLPAMPSEGGYDDYTIALYRKSHNGNNPPENSKDTEWVQWRADILTKYLERIYKRVKEINKDIIISMSPSIYPWSKEEYLQDWPTWLNNGYVELVCPQVYRYDIENYKSALNEIVQEQVSKENLFRIYPGMLLKVGSYYASEDMIKEMIKVNRNAGLSGEVYFFYEGLKKYPKYFENEFGKNPLTFPNLLK